MSRRQRHPSLPFQKPEEEEERRKKPKVGPLKEHVEEEEEELPPSQKPMFSSPMQTTVPFEESPEAMGVPVEKVRQMSFDSPHSTL
jgi:hypothetical protein